MTKLVVRGLPDIRSPFSSFPSLFSSDFFSDIDDLFAQLSCYDKACGNLSLRKGFPKGDVFRDEDGNIVIELMLAGYSKDQLSVTIQSNSLIISATKSSDNQKGRSRSCRSFTKTFPNFTHEWDLENSNISYVNGLLSIVVPPKKQKEQEVKELEIK